MIIFVLIMTRVLIHLWKSLSRDQVKDTGIILVIMILVSGYLTKNQFFYSLSIPLLLIVIVCPSIYYPFAFLWIGLAKILGFVMSRVILSVIYFLVVCPVGLLRRLSGKDNMQIRSFKKNTATVFKVRDIDFVAKDIEKPF